MLFIKDLVRFAGVGAANTAVTFVLFQLLLLVFNPTLAYTITWLAGLAIVFILYPNYVFSGGRTSLGARTLVIVVYGVSYLLGLGTLIILKNFGLDPRFGIVASLAATSAFSFFTARFVLRSK